MKNLTAVLFSILIVFTFSCKREADIGPAYRMASDKFFVIGNTLNATPSSVDFETQTVSIDASFSETVSWTVRLLGLESGAVKTIKGLSQNLSDNGTNIWNGSHDELYFFKAGEKVAIELSFLGTNNVFRDTITISKVKRYSAQGIIVAKPSVSSTLEGFEGSSFDFNTPFWSYGIYGDAGEVSGPTGSATKRDTMNPLIGLQPIEGKYVITLKGTDINNNYFVGGIKRLIQTSEKAIIPADPSEVYVNIYIYGKGNSTSRLNYGFVEADNDEYEKQIVLDHTGWKLFSFKYSDLDKGFNSAGNNIKEPNTLSAVSFNLISSPSGKQVEATFDFPIVTFGTPFNPQE